MIEQSLWTEEMWQVFLYLDFKKAFDSVPRAQLLKKVHAYGFRGNLFNWLKDFLKGRKQRVSVNDSLSSWSEVFSRLPQGSVLGPLFLPSLLMICHR